MAGLGKQNCGREILSQLQRGFWILLLVLCLGSIVSSGMDALYTDMLFEYWGMSIEFAGRVSSLQFGLSAVGMPLVGIMLDRHGLLATSLAVGTTVECLSLVSLAVLPPEFQALTMGLAKVFSQAALWPCVSRLVPVSRFGCAFGIIVMGQNLAMTVGPPTAGAIRDTTGMGAVMVAWASMMGIAACAGWWLRHDDRSARGAWRLERLSES